VKGTIWWSIPDLRAFLCGNWRVDRSVLDGRRSILGEFRGHASFTRAGDSLLYEERGTLRFGVHHGPAEQCYRYDFGEGDARAIVSFRDGRMFHELDLSTGEALATHACEPDHYEGRFTALGPMQWHTAWKVSGPRKEQDILTLYTRQS
jgi:hypothetical protein